MNKMACLVCGHKTISRRGSFEVCPVCFWEDEGVIDNPTVSTDGPNGSLSLNQARENYQIYRAVDKKFVNQVRNPLPEEQ